MIGVGVNFGISTYANQRFHVINIVDGKVDSERDFNVPYRLTSNNISGRVGITLKEKVEVYAGYYMPASITKNASNGIDMSFYRFGVNYLFGKK